MEVLWPRPCQGVTSALWLSFGSTFHFYLVPREKSEYSLFAFHSALDPMGFLPSGIYNLLGKKRAETQ